LRAEDRLRHGQQVTLSCGGRFQCDGKLYLAVANPGSIFVNDPGPNIVSILLNTRSVLNPMDDSQFLVRQHYRDFSSASPHRRPGLLDPTTFQNKLSKLSRLGPSK